MKIQTRNGKDWTEKFPDLVTEFKKLSIDEIVLDGEVVHFDKQGRTDFSELQNFMNKKKVKLDFVVFDALYASGHNLMNAPFETRREFIEGLFKKIKSKSISLSEHLNYSKDILDKACKKKWEGIIAKRKDSKYIQKRTPSWLKIKCGNREEFVVIGITKPQGERDQFGSLLIAEKVNQGLEFRGKVGTGFDDKTLKELYKKFKEKELKKAPQVKNINKKGVLFWIRPFFYAEIDYSERTPSGRLRHPVFKGLRLDKNFNQKESTDKDETIEFSNPDRVLFSENKITKNDLWNYYQEIMPHFLQNVQRSLLTIVRCPQGSSKVCFYQKHFDDKTEHPKIISIKEKTKKEIYSYIEEENDLKALIQLGVLEIHAWGSRANDVERPLYLVFDLDPDEEISFHEVVDASHTIKKELEENGMKVYIRTTGGKGLHLVTPLPQKMSWDEAYEFSREIATALAKKYDNFIATSSKKKRKGKIFIDYMRNSRGSTAIVNFSTRAKPGATVATPLHWREVNSKLDPKKFTIETVPTRLKKQKKDPWEEFWKEIEA